MAACDPTVFEARFPVMGTTAHLMVVDGPVDALEAARNRLVDLEQRWSRFMPDSELMRLNESPGRPVVVSAATFDLVAAAVDACGQTGGRFDPTMEATMRQAGYDRPLAELRPPSAPDTDRTPGPGSAHAAVELATGLGIGPNVELDPALSAITLPHGVRLDLGGIAKGAAADLVADELMAAGCGGCCVNVGGDLRVTGTSPRPGGWRVTLDSPGATSRRSISVVDGAVCTSTKLFRRWRSDHGVEHHLRAPTTGRPIDNGLASTTVVAARAAQAEVLSIAMFVAGPDEATTIADEFEVTGQLVTDDGAVVDLAGLEPFLTQRWQPSPRPEPVPTSVVSAGPG